jgi:hypothetical protein
VKKLREVISIRELPRETVWKIAEGLPNRFSLRAQKGKMGFFDAFHSLKSPHSVGPRELPNRF